MAAYVILDVDVIDAERYADYKEMSGEALAAHGGKFLVRGGKAEVLEGEWTPNRVVVLEFESVEQAKAWWSSKEYAEAKKLRQDCSRGNMILIEGV